MKSEIIETRLFWLSAFDFSLSAPGHMKTASTAPFRLVDFRARDANDNAGRSDSARWNVGDPDAGMDAMIERQSHANRRRRWWLRALSEQKRQHAGSMPSALVDASAEVPASVAALGSREETQRRHWAAQFLRDCRIPDQAALILSHRDRGTRLRVPLLQPVLRVGASEMCDLRLPASEVAPRECLLVWLAGSLHRITPTALGEETLEEIQPSSVWHWGRWQVTVTGFPPRSAAHERPTDGLEIRLVSEAAPIVTAASIPDGLSCLGQQADRLTVTSAPQSDSAWACLLRVPQRVWLLNPWQADAVRVNDRVWPVCGLEPGDRISVGQIFAQMTVHWPEAPAAAPVPAVRPASLATSGSDWEQFLLEQSTRLTQMQQSLQELSRESHTVAGTVDRRVLLEQIQELAAACARDAALAQAVAPLSNTVEVVEATA